LAILEAVCQAHSLWFLPLSLMNCPQYSQDLEVGVSEDDVARCEEFEEEAIAAIAELQLYYPVCAYLGQRGASASLEVFSEARGKGRWRSSGWARELGGVKAETRVDD